MTAIRKAPVPFLGLTVSIPMMILLSLMVIAGVPASIRQLVMYADPDYQPSGEITAFLEYLLSTFIDLKNELSKECYPRRYNLIITACRGNREST